MCIIGVCVSCVAWVLKMSVEESTIFFTHHLEHLLDNSKSSDSDIAVVYAWFFAVGWSVCWAVLASLLVVVGHPPASGSGVPEVIGYLNGVDIKEIISIRTFVVKLFSCIFINISGLPVGAEGPIIHLLLADPGTNCELSTTFRCAVVREVAKTMGALQELKIWHGDLRSAHVVVFHTEVEPGLVNVKLDLSRSPWLTQVCGPPAWQSPERAKAGPSPLVTHPNAEVWSLGCLVLEAFSHPYTPPFGNASAQDIRERLRQGERPTGLSLFMQSTPLTQESESGIFKKKKNCKYSAKTFALLRGEVLPFLYKAFQVRIIIVGLMVFLHHNYRLRSSHSSVTFRPTISFPYL